MTIIAILLIVALVFMLATRFAPTRPSWLANVAFALWAILVTLVLVGVGVRA
jgi:hypothetical protein